MIPDTFIIGLHIFFKINSQLYQNEPVFYHSFNFYSNRSIISSALKSLIFITIYSGVGYKPTTIGGKGVT